MSNKCYDFLKWFATVALPAFGTLYYALSGVWGLPYGAETLETITAIVTCLGVLLGLSSISYNQSIKDGKL